MSAGCDVTDGRGRHGTARTRPPKPARNGIATRWTLAPPLACCDWPAGTAGVGRGAVATRPMSTVVFTAMFTVSDWQASRSATHRRRGGVPSRGCRRGSPQRRCCLATPPEVPRVALNETRVTVSVRDAPRECGRPRTNQTTTLPSSNSRHFYVEWPFMRSRTGAGSEGAETARLVGDAA